MYYGKKQLVLTALAAIALGFLLHFLHTWFPDPVTALFSPVRESLWEHGKIIFWPFLLASLWLNRGRPGGVRPWLLAVTLMLTAMLVLGYVWNVLLGGKPAWVNIAMFVLLMVLGFWGAGRASGPFSGPLGVAPIVLAVLWGVLFLLFTLWPPEGIFFADLSETPTWITLPC